MHRPAASRSIKLMQEREGGKKKQQQIQQKTEPVLLPSLGEIVHIPAAAAAVQVSRYSTKSHGARM